MWGVGEKRKYGYLSFKEAYGIGVLHGQWYPKQEPENKNWKHHNNFNWKHFLALRDGEVDILLNIDKCTLSICVVGHLQSGFDAQLMKLPTLETESGWVPHVNTYKYGQQVRVAKIPVTWYGIPKNELLSYIS